MEIPPAGKHSLLGRIKVPGDKSISHRALIFASIASGNSKIKGLLEAEDCLHTLEIMQNLGVEIINSNSREYRIKGVGMYGIREADKVLDCGNSGTTMRILSGLLAAQNYYYVLSGDNSLRNRPMTRIKIPLQKMGAEIWSRKNGRAPLSIKGGKLNTIEYDLPVASAQVKSAILLAGLYTSGIVKIREPALSRDHTEKMLKMMGVDLKKEGKEIILNTKDLSKLNSFNIEIPADISSAAFILAGGLIVKGSELLVKNVGINYTRNGFLEILKKMDADITLHNKAKSGSEPTADIKVKYGELKGVNIAGEIIPRLLDEIPILAVLATQAEGKTVIRDAEELRVKETDRLKALSSELIKIGADIKELKDGLIVKGPVELSGGRVKSHGDHRIAMALAIAGLVSNNGVEIENSEVVANSFPDFQEKLLKVLYNYN